jgi:hypothetical protein
MGGKTGVHPDLFELKFSVIGGVKRRSTDVIIIVALLCRIFTGGWKRCGAAQRPDSIPQLVNKRYGSCRKNNVRRMGGDASRLLFWPDLNFMSGHKTFDVSLASKGTVTTGP